MFTCLDYNAIEINFIFFLKLMLPFPATAITIALPAVEYNPIDFTECTVAGWGGKNNSAVVSIMLKLNIRSSILRQSPREIRETWSPAKKLKRDIEIREAKLKGKKKK